MEYEAVYLVHCPARPVYACEKHTKILINIHRALGFHIVAQAVNPGHVCNNCKNEAKREVNNERQNF